MKLLNQNTPLSNYIYTILNEKNNQIKESILLGDINFPKILFYSKRKEENTLKTASHIEFLNNLYRQKQLSEIREEKSNLEKKINMVDNQLLSIKNYNISQNKLNFNERYLNTNLNNNIKNHSNINSEKNSKNKNNKKKSSSSEKKKNVYSLPSLGKPPKKHKRIHNIALKPIQIKSFKSNSKVNNHETEERLEKNAKAFIQKINNNKKKFLDMINKKNEKFSLKLKNEIEKNEKLKKLQLDEFSRNYNINNNNIDYYNINNINNYTNLDNNMRKEENKYSPDNSKIINNKPKKKYYHYSPYNYKNPKMLKNISKDLLNFNSELYYNNNIPDIIQYQFLLAPLYQNNNMIKKIGSSPLIIIDDIDNLRNNNNPEIVDMTNGEVVGNISRINNYSYRNDESNIDNNNIDNSFNKKHLYYFNEPKYEIELTYGDNEIEQTKIKNNNV